MRLQRRRKNRSDPQGKKKIPPSRRKQIRPLRRKQIRLQRRKKHIRSSRQKTNPTLKEIKRIRPSRRKSRNDPQGENRSDPKKSYPVQQKRCQGCYRLWRDFSIRIRKLRLNLGSTLWILRSRIFAASLQSSLMRRILLQNYLRYDRRMN